MEEFGVNTSGAKMEEFGVNTSVEAKGVAEAEMQTDKSPQIQSSPS